MLLLGYALEALRAKQRTRATSAIVLSSNHRRRLMERSRELGAVDFLPKRTNVRRRFLQLCLPGFALAAFRGSRNG
jgi:PleD family two-component response regulator